MLEVKTSMNAICLKLNETKTDFIYFGSQQHTTNVQHRTIMVINETITRYDKG